MTHYLKTWSEYYKEVETGTKTFEVRKNDRNFKTGDTLILQEFLKNEQILTGKELKFKVIYIIHGGAFGLEEGYVVMGIKATASGDLSNQLI